MLREYRHSLGRAEVTPPGFRATGAAQGGKGGEATPQWAPLPLTVPPRGPLLCAIPTRQGRCQSCFSAGETWPPTQPAPRAPAAGRGCSRAGGRTVLLQKLSPSQAPGPLRTSVRRQTGECGPAPPTSPVPPAASHTPELAGQPRGGGWGPRAADPGPGFHAPPPPRLPESRPREAGGEEEWAAGESRRHTPRGSDPHPLHRGSTPPAGDCAQPLSSDALENRPQRRGSSSLEGGPWPFLRGQAALRTGTPLPWSQPSFLRTPLPRLGFEPQGEAAPGCQGNSSIVPGAECSGQAPSVSGPALPAGLQPAEPAGPHSTPQGLFVVGMQRRGEIG